jgi:hypothetical protein
VNPENIGKYLDLIDKLIKVGSGAVPIFTLFLRRLKVVAPNVPPTNILVVAAGVAGFGCLGSIIGLSSVLIIGVGAVIFIGVQWMNALAPTGGAPIDWGVFAPLFSKTNITCVSLSIVSTLITFGGKDQPKGLAFVGGIFFGTAVALMFLLSTFIH